MTCRMSVPQLGIKPMSPAVDAHSLNHWAAREVPILFTLIVHWNYILHGCGSTKYY